MTNIDDRLKDIADIRTMMERSSKFLSLSGLSGVSAGVVALAGSVAAYFRVHSENPEDLTSSTLAKFFMVDASVVLVLAIGLALFFSYRMTKKIGISFGGPTARVLLFHLMIPLVVGGAFVLLLLYHGAPQLIPAAMLTFYGLALLNASKYTLGEISTLAFLELLLGLCAGLWSDQWIYFWAFGFGVLHIGYGLYMYRKYEAQ